MKRKAIAVMILSLVAVMFFVSGALADKFVCVTNQGLKGADTVGMCVAKGEQFAVVDNRGVVHILTPQELELTKSLNPGLFEQPAYGYKHLKEAPEMKVFGSVPLPKE
jgi:hypothetical protein